MTNAQVDDLSGKIADNLPYLRRYARALTGSQESGDQYAVVALEAVLETPSLFSVEMSPRVALFKVFHSIWSPTGGQLGMDEEGLKAKAQKHLAHLTSGTREALLLHTIEELPVADVATVLDLSQAETEDLIRIAYDEMAKSISGSIMVIEDEAIIALDLEAIVADMGHKATGVARTADGAVELFGRERPDLILSDIHLADGSSGIDAVNTILADAGDIPVIFITAYPERLLTGDGPEPAFLITKPYSEAQVRSAISQAMFFASTETLKA
ncbi:MAG: response regulator [Pseudomonadota bacterium]